jgi:hypothetical protein
MHQLETEARYYREAQAHNERMGWRDAARCALIASGLEIIAPDAYRLAREGWRPVPMIPEGWPCSAVPCLETAIASMPEPDGEDHEHVSQDLCPIHLLAYVAAGPYES